MPPWRLLMRTLTSLSGPLRKSVSSAGKIDHDYQSGRFVLIIASSYDLLRFISTRQFGSETKGEPFRCPLRADDLRPWLSMFIN
jgi:hypothetical protein